MKKQEERDKQLLKEEAKELVKSLK